MAVQVNPQSIDLLSETNVVGTNPDLLFDSDDATYVEAVSPTGFGSSVQILMGAASIGSLSAIPLYVRAMYRVASGTPPSPLGMTVNAYNLDSGDTYGFFTSNVSYGYEFTAPNTIETPTTWTWNEDHTGATADAITALADGTLRIRFDSRVSDLSDAGLRIFECYLFGEPVTLAEFVYGMEQTVYVTRLLPRDDPYGVSGPNRIVPAPRLGRVIGNQP